MIGIRFAAIFEMQFRGPDLQPQLKEFTKVPAKSRYRSRSGVYPYFLDCTLNISLTDWSGPLSLVQHLIRVEWDIEKTILIFESATTEYSNDFQHDHAMYGFIISRLISVNKFKPAEELLDRMKEEKCSFTKDVFLCLCRSYGRVHRPLGTFRIFQKMKEFQCEPTDKSYVTMFSILSENQLKLAQMFHKYMKQVGLPPSASFLNVFIKISEAKELFRKMNVKGCSLTVIAYTSLIHGPCLYNILDEAMELFEEMSRKGIKPNVVTFSSLIDGLCKGGRSLQALKLLEKMVGKRFSASTIIYNNLVSGLCKVEKVPDAVQILDRMKLQGLKPDVVLYGRLVNSLCNSSKF
ncbi:hypothetical protein GIB67_032232 [Kingdonia uniflora]|uniref:Pentatricopeptide repeat-containing protein n=1 Tax=Kingdonia uniflora TaxID=39325 RepID=A0A7J7MWY9_9MAGN|nr:hypothetical protein GIB67_032232 [Kingdonia uniflora]